MRKMVFSLIAVLALSLAFTGKGYAEGMGGQVFYRFGQAQLTDNRGGEVFTDTLGLSGNNNDDTGMVIGAGLDIPLVKRGSVTLLGEILVEYARFSEKEVLQTTSVITANHAGQQTNVKKVTVSALQVVIAPKLRFDTMGGKLRPWIIPAGLAFLVNSPPSDDTNYLDFGYHVGAGVEYMILDELSIGADVRHTFGQEEPNTNTSYTSYSVYLGINF